LIRSCGHDFTQLDSRQACFTATITLYERVDMSRVDLATPDIGLSMFDVPGCAACAKAEDLAEILAPVPPAPPGSVDEMGIEIQGTQGFDVAMRGPQPES
jgi:hypothetical protein